MQDKSNWPEWLKKAEVSDNADVEILDVWPFVIFKKGSFRGEWRGGEWRGGEWQDGVWRGGEWQDG